ncbi:Hypothetical protein CINCED_3A017160 [Cinara cedri]|nr:Hypothetical protein CINCED_3A017160 [Cinara cedri]
MVEQGFYFDALSCEAKWRSLKKVYMYNKTKTVKKDGSKHTVVWAHYHDMDRAIKGISYDISDIFDGNDDDVKECSANSCITTIRDYENTNSILDGSDDKCQWTNVSTKELIRLYGKHRSKFTAVNQGGKHLLWQEIAQQLAQMGYQYSANACNDKWRNLKMTYKKNKQRGMKYGTQYIKWIYFKEIDNILKNPSSHESTDIGNIITVSLTDANELEDIKKKLGENHFDDCVDFQTQDVDIIENNDNNNDNDGISSISENWTEAATKCLIDLWGMYRSRFMLAPQGKKRFLWNEISEQLRQNGHNYSGLVCDRKWRLLKANYLKRKEKYKKLGIGAVKWQYYHDLDRLLGVPTETISWSMESTMCLIESFDHHKDKFMKAATGGKLAIWKQIAEEMLQHGFSYSARACDNKWRTLKNRYNKNKMRANRNKKVVWVYYNKIDAVLKELNKEDSNDQEKCNIDKNNHNSCEKNDSGEHNYIKTMKPEFSIKPETIAEIKDIFMKRNIEFDQRFKEIEDNLNNRDQAFEKLQQQTLEALNKSNELETRKLRLLEQLVSRLPHHIS